MEKFNHFDFEISFGIDNEACTSYSFEFIYKYTFYKTKNNKFYFGAYCESDSNVSYGYEANIEFIIDEVMICNNRNYKDYFYKNKEMLVVGGKGEEYFIDGLNNDYLNINAFSIIKNNNSMEFLYLLNEFENNNNLETIIFDYLDIEEIEQESKFFDNLKKFKKLRIFANNKNFSSLNNEQLMTLLKCLSEFKYLLKIFIHFEEKLELDEKDKKLIYELFPGISIETSKNNSIIYWINNNPIMKIL